MPECPICGEYFMDQDKVSAHIYQEHPEKVGTPDSMARAIAAAGEEQNLCYVAALLAESSLRHNKSAKDVAFRWYEILLRLRSTKEFDKRYEHEESDRQNNG